MSSPTLQQRLDAMCSPFPGTTGICAHKLATGEEAAINADLRFPTASMIKIMILFELLRACARGAAELGERITLRRADRTLGSGLLMDFDAGATLTLRDLAVMMMAISDNTATNVLIDRLGKDAINEATRAAGMPSTELRHRIDFDLLRESPDNLAVTTPRDYVHFFTSLRRGELLPTTGVDQLLGIMRIQKYIEPMRKLLPFNPYDAEFGREPKVWVASKTGGLDGVRCEAGLIHAYGVEWALVVCAKGFQSPVSAYDNPGSELISRVSRTVFEEWAPSAG